MRKPVAVFAFCIALAPWATPVFAQSASIVTTSRTTPAEAQKERQDREEEHKPADPDTGKSTLSDETLKLLPNPWERRGIKFSASYVSDFLSNLQGGARQGAAFEGRLNTAIDLDFGVLADHPGLAFHANTFLIHGPGLSRSFVENLIVVSSIEAKPTFRLYEAWFEQKFGSDRFSIRAGQVAADTEFLTSKYTDVFLNSTYGWPAINGVNLPSGGPSPPLAALGARLKAVVDPFTLLLAVFNGDPAGSGLDDPQSRDLYGINFRLRDGALALGEVQYAFNQKPGQPALPGTLKLGGWYHSGNFRDPRLASNGVSQASLLASLEPLQHRGDYGIYGVFEQLLLPLKKDEIPQGIGFFFRGAVNPSDRNRVDLYGDAGVNVAGFSQTRPNDKIGLGLAVLRISDSARTLDEDFAQLRSQPVRSFEALATLSYLAEIKTGWTILPTLQYVIRPGGGYVIDGAMPVAVRNAVIVGLRSVLKF